MFSTSLDFTCSVKCSNLSPRLYRVFFKEIEFLLTNSSVLIMLYFIPHSLNASTGLYDDFHFKKTSKFENTKILTTCYSHLKIYI